MAPARLGRSVRPPAGAVTAPTLSRLPEKNPSDGFHAPSNSTSCGSVIDRRTACPDGKPPTVNVPSAAIRPYAQRSESA